MAATPRFFKSGQFLFKEGEPSRSMFLIKRGTIAIRKMKGSAYVEIARVYANEVLGELSFFDRLPRSASAVAMTEVEVLEIRFDALDKIYGGVPDYMKSIMASVADRLRKANETIRRLQKNTVAHERNTTQPAPGSPAEIAQEADLSAALDNLPGDAPGDDSGDSGDPNKSDV
jgi:CRP-like cAMP-binding protein